MAVELRELKVICHPDPLLLIGTDVLCGGREGWNFRAIGINDDGTGLLTFARGKRTLTVPLLNAPNLRSPAPRSNLRPTPPSFPPKLREREGTPAAPM